MNLYLSRNGQTFGPYTVDQARTFLNSKQLLETDFALIEGTSEWKLLPEILGRSEKNSDSIEHAEDVEN